MLRLIQRVSSFYGVSLEYAAWLTLSAVSETASIMACIKCGQWTMLLPPLMSLMMSYVPRTIPEWRSCCIRLAALVARRLLEGTKTGTRRRRSGRSPSQEGANRPLPTD